MSLYANQYNASSLVSSEKLKEISIVLKTGRTIQSKVMDLILTILGCIVQKIDHRTRLHEFKDVFSNRNLRILRNDLENLLYFNTKLFNSLILELILEALTRESNHRNRCIRLNTNEEPPNRQWNRVVIQRRVKAVVKFLIFRKMTTITRLHGEDDTSDWSCCRESINVVLNNRISPRNVFVTNNTVFDKNEHAKRPRDKYERKSIDQIYCATRNKRINEMEKLQSCSKTGYDFHGTSKYVCVRHFCSKIYCLFCYGWLWLPVCYISTFLYTALMNVTYQLIYEIVI